MSNTFEFNIPNGNEQALEKVDELIREFENKIEDKRKAKKTDLTKYAIAFADEENKKDFVSKLKEDYGIVGNN